MSVDYLMVKWVDEYVAQYGCGMILTTSYIKDEIGKTGLEEGSIIPSDHCYNRVNNDPTSLEGKTALFIYLKRNSYQCVGSKYKYDGPIMCRPRGVSRDIKWGDFDSRARKKVQSPVTPRTNGKADE